MKMNHLTDYYKSVFVFRFISSNNDYSFRVYTIFLWPLSQQFDFLCFLRFVLFFVVFALKEASFSDVLTVRTPFLVSVLDCDSDFFRNYPLHLRKLRF